MSALAAQLQKELEESAEVGWALSELEVGAAAAAVVVVGVGAGHGTGAETEVVALGTAVVRTECGFVVAWAVRGPGPEFGVETVLLPVVVAADPPSRELRSDTGAHHESLGLSRIFS